MSSPPLDFPPFPDGNLSENTIFNEVIHGRAEPADDPDFAPEGPPARDVHPPAFQEDSRWPKSFWESYSLIAVMPPKKCVCRLSYLFHLFGILSL